MASTMAGFVTLALLAAATRTLAGTPFGDDDAGFVPPDKTTLACQTRVEKHFAKLIRGAASCHVAAARAGVKGEPFDEEACEDSVRARYDGAISKLVGCPMCLDAAALATAEMARIDTAVSALVYCDPTSGTPLGDADDVGFIPANTHAGKCQNHTAKRLAQLAGAIIKCHIRLAADAFDSGVPDTVGEEACESAARARYDASVAKLESCPACLDPMVRSTLGGLVVAAEDMVVGQVYCASSSGNGSSMSATGGTAAR